MALALLMALWAASGVVMMYVAYPATTTEERLAGLASLDLAECCVQSALPKGAIDGAAVEMLDGRPVLRWHDDTGSSRLLDLRSGVPQPIDRTKAERIAAAHYARATGRSASFAAEAIGHDQWTVSGEFKAHAPLYRARAADPAGTVLYVSGTTGEVVQDTTRSERFWNWLGAVPHWLYFAKLRENGPLWSQVVIYASLLGTFLTAIGLYIGISQIGPRGRRLPYRGIAWWHHATGLVFGVLTLTWVLSGLMSMNPWGWMESQEPGEELAALAGRGETGGDARLLVEALAAAPPADAVRAELSIEGGIAFAILADRTGVERRASLPGLAPAPLSHAELDALAGRAKPGVAYAAGLIREPDAYYYGHHETVTLPAWRVIYRDAGQTRLYFDPATGALTGYADAPSRAFRWWHSGLHRFDFAQGLRQRPVWDLVVLPLMLGVTLLTLIGVWLAFGRLRKTFVRRRRT